MDPGAIHRVATLGTLLLAMTSGPHAEAEGRVAQIRLVELDGPTVSRELCSDPESVRINDQVQYSSHVVNIVAPYETHLGGDHPRT